MRSILLALPLFAAVSLSGCEKGKVATTGDVSFARSAFTLLVKGDAVAQDKIDWPVLTALGQNVGVSYNAVPTETEKAKFRSDFVTSFATSFRENGGSVDAFTNWQTTFHDSTRTEVTADSPSGLLKLTVSERNSAGKISSIDIVK